MGPETRLFILSSSKYSLSIHKVFNTVHCMRNWEFNDKWDRLRPCSHGTCNLRSRRNRWNKQINTLLHNCRRDCASHSKRMVIASSWVLCSLRSSLGFHDPLTGESTGHPPPCLREGPPHGKMPRITWERWWQLGASWLWCGNWGWGRGMILHGASLYRTCFSPTQTSQDSLKSS